MIWSRVNAIKLLPDRFSFSWPGTKVCCIILSIWSLNCDIIQTVKSENVKIVKSSVCHVEQSSLNLLCDVRFREYTQWCSQRFRESRYCSRHCVNISRFRELRIYFGRRKLFCVSIEDMGQWQGQVQRPKLLGIFAAKTFLLLTETMQCKCQKINNYWNKSVLKLPYILK